MAPRLRRSIALALLCGTFSLGGAEASRAACPRNGGTVCTAPRDQLQLSADATTYSDGYSLPTSIMFVAWTDLRDSSTTGADLYFGSVPACMDSADSPGQAVCVEPGDQDHPAVAVSGVPSSGPNPLPYLIGFGVIVAWQDHRGADLDIFSRRMNGEIWSGLVAWDEAGIATCAAAGDQTDPVVVEYGRGGAIIAWVDRRSGGADIYAQCIDSLGVPLWPADGVPVCTAPGDQVELRARSDGERGVFLFWLDRRAEDAIYATRVTPAGTLASGWSTDGNRMSGAPAAPVDLFPVRGGGASVFVFWTDTRDDPGGDVYGQHVDGDGTPWPGWPADGLPVATGSRLQRASDAAQNGDGGAYVLWLEESATAILASPADNQLRAQRLGASGAVDAGWPAAGQVVCDAPGRREHARGARSLYGDNGLVAVWSDGRNGAEQADLYGLRLRSDGSLESGWTPNGTRFLNAPDVQTEPVLTSSVTGGGRVAWIDYRDRATRGADVYGGGFTGDGRVGVIARVPSGIALGPARPNPSTAAVSFALQLAAPARVTAEVIDLAGRRVRALLDERVAPGTRTLSWNGRDAQDGPASPGIYLLRVRLDDSAVVRRFVVIH